MIKHWYLVAFALLLSCDSKKEWVFKENIPLEGISPLGIIQDNGTLIISDPDNNRIVRTDFKGSIIEEWRDIQRPMHIDLSDNKIFSTEFINDRVIQLENGQLSEIKLNISFDAPAGVDVDGNKMAIADFYSHYVHLINGEQVIQIGGEGHEDGKLYYPTDVKLYQDKVLVADAYNNRIQIFSDKGDFIKVNGWQEEINVASGLDVYSDQIYVTDFHNSRVLIYDFEGTLLGIFENLFDKPTDIYIHQDRMYVANYGGGSITVFGLQ